MNPEFLKFIYSTVLPWALKQGLVNPGAPSPQGMTMKEIWDRYLQVNPIPPANINIPPSELFPGGAVYMPGQGGPAPDPKMWAEREKAIREHIPSKNNGDVTEEYYKQAKILLEKEGGWSLNMDTTIAQTMLKQKYEEKQIMDAMKSISPCVPGALSEGAQTYANGIMKMVTPDVNSVVQTSTPVQIGDLRKTLNAHMDEIIAQHTDLSQQRDQVKGAPLTKE